MEKERINLFETEPKKLPERTVPAYVAIRRGGAAFFSVIALGVALFAVVFIICCFYFEFVDDYYTPRDETTTADSSSDNTNVTSSPIGEMPMPRRLRTARKMSVSALTKAFSMR